MTPDLFAVAAVGACALAWTLRRDWVAERAVDREARRDAVLRAVELEPDTSNVLKARIWNGADR